MAVEDGGELGPVVAALRERFPETKNLLLYDEPSIVRILLDDLTVDFVVFDIILFLTAILAGLGVRKRP